MRLKLIALVAVSAMTSLSTAQAYDLMDIYKEAFMRDPVVQQYKAQRDQAYAAIDAQPTLMS